MGTWPVAIETLKMTSEVRAVRVEHTRHAPARHKNRSDVFGNRNRMELNRKVLLYRSSATVCVTVDVGREPDGSRAPSERRTLYR